MPIDFVMTWVDDTDEQWLAEKNEYAPKYMKNNTINGDCRYRDWDILKYWFRSVEKYATWVRKIHFVTCGHLPDFLNVNHPKLNIVKHSDYIPQEYLPTFSARAIELNFHRIPDLTEQFVYFNDDMFLNAPLSQEDFFKGGKPCTQFLERSFVPTDNLWLHVVLNDMGLINKHFSKRDFVKKNLFKYLNPKYGKRNKYHLLTIACRNFHEIENMHVASPLLKSTLEEVWEKEHDVLDATSRDKFRTLSGVNQYIFSSWDIVRGNFCPSRSISRAYNLCDDNLQACVEDIKYGKNKLICVNDTQDVTDFERVKKAVINAFEYRYPCKSGFEK
jgi:hypothetical protein